MPGGLNYAAFAVPIFTFAVVAEALVARKRRPQAYALGTALSDVGCGAIFQALEVFFNLALLGVYAWVFENASLIEFEDGSPWPWVIGMIAIDFLYYWWHRHSHVVNSLWAVHGVHHQSEDYNLAVALRQPILEPLTWFPYYLPLAFFGIDPTTVVICYGLNLFFQFWIHTELVGTLGPLEWVFNTPSHHRVHHGVQEQYLDRNYGGILILWDRLFGTFEKEDERPYYGTTIPLRSYNPVWANFEHFARIRSLAAGAKTLREKLWAPWAHPAWLPAGVSPPDKPERNEKFEKYRPEPPAKRVAYVIGHAVVAVIGLFTFVLYQHMLPAPLLIVSAGMLVWTFVNLSGIIEQRSWASRSEKGRLAGIVAWAMLLAWTMLG